jgi:hypothetical protein
VPRRLEPRTPRSPGVVHLDEARRQALGIRTEVLARAI